MTPDDTPEPTPHRHPTTADVVLQAIRDGYHTRETIVEHTGLNPSAVGIALTQLYTRGLATRQKAGYTAGQPGPRHYVYNAVTPTP